MDVRTNAMAGFARQLGKPSGLRGRLVGRLLNLRNRRAMGAAVEALSLAPGATAADLGFGGGGGLEYLLNRVGPTGQVHGVDMSETMLDRAAHRFRRDATTGRLQLYKASMTRLPMDADSLDGVITLNTVYYVSELDRAFAELARVLKSSGRATVGLADPNAMAARSFTRHGLRLRSVPEIIAQLRDAGLTVEDHRRINLGQEEFHLLVGKPATSRD